MWWTRALYVADKWSEVPSLNTFKDRLLDEESHSSPHNIDIESGCFALVIGGEDVVNLVVGPIVVVGSTNTMKYKIGLAVQTPASSHASAIYGNT